VLLCLKRIISNRSRLFSITVLLSAASCSYAFAEAVSTEEWNIAADKVIRYEDPNSLVAQGNVVLEKRQKLPPPPKKEQLLSSWSELLGEKPEEKEVAGDEAEKDAEPTLKTTVTIKADWMVYDVDMETIKAKGNVRVITGDDRLTASEGTLNLKDETGKFTDATVIHKEKSLHLEGKSIEKTGFDTYRVVDGWVITCKLEEGETPPWSLKSKNTDIRENGYAVLKHATFNIMDVPVLYTPYFIVPVKNTRQTGFLFPEISKSSNRGFGFNLPFFINISDSMDATLFPEFYSKRGFMPGMEFRYFTDTTNKGTFTASYLNDKLSDPSEVDYYADTGYTHDNKDRYWIRGKANHNFGDWQSRLDIDIVSDQDYLREFDDGYTGFDNTQEMYLEDFGRGFRNNTEALRENSFKLLRTWRGISLATTFLAINDSETTADTDVDETAVDETSTEITDTFDETPLWKLPSVDFKGTLPIGETGITFDWIADYVNYWREEGIGGHRFDIRPSVSSSIPLSAYLESRAEFAVRNTYYIVEEYGDAEWENDSTQNRFFPEFETEVATTLERDYFFGESATRTSSHQMRPFVRYNYIMDVDQDELPDFDSVDYISDTNSITYGIDNFFSSYRTVGENTEKSRDYGYIKIQQSYDLRSESSDEPFGDIYARVAWYPLTRTSVIYRGLYDVYDNRFNSHTFEGSYRNSRGDAFAIDYSQKEASDIEQINASIKAHLFDKWIAAASVQHSISEDETESFITSLTYEALCWSVKFETRYTPEDTAFLIKFKLANIGVPLGIDF
jgi:LPS-assembly protein